MLKPRLPDLPLARHLSLLVILHNEDLLRYDIQCSAEKFQNWGQCPRALEKLGTFEKKVGTLCEK